MQTLEQLNFQTMKYLSTQTQEINTSTFNFQLDQKLPSFMSMILKVKLCSNKISELNNTINIETLKSGMYFIKVEFKNKLYHQKFIVQ